MSLAWTHTKREKCPYSELFWSVFSRSQIEYTDQTENMD